MEFLVVKEQITETGAGLERVGDKVETSDEKILQVHIKGLPEEHQNRVVCEKLRQLFQALLSHIFNEILLSAIAELHQPIHLASVIFKRQFAGVNVVQEDVKRVVRNVGDLDGVCCVKRVVTAFRELRIQHRLKHRRSRAQNQLVTTQNPIFDFERTVGEFVYLSQTVEAFNELRVRRKSFGVVRYLKDVEENEVIKICLRKRVSSVD